MQFTWKPYVEKDPLNFSLQSTKFGTLRKLASCNSTAMKTTIPKYSSFGFLRVVLSSTLCYVVKSHLGSFCPVVFMGKK